MEKILTTLSAIAKYPIWVFKNNQLIYINEEFRNDFEIATEKFSMDDFNEDLKALINQVITDNIDTNNFIYNGVEYSHKITKDTVDEDEYKIGILERLTFAISGDDDYLSILNTIVDNIPEIVFYKDLQGKYLGANKHCLNFYKARGIDSIIGKTDYDLDLDEEFLQTCVKHDNMVINTKKPLYIEEKVPSLNGDEMEFVETIKTPILNEKNEVCGIVGLARDITLNKRRITELKKLSRVDKLTGLYNRGHFDKMIQVLDNEDNYPLSVIVGDVDGLKITNDAFGHLVGDELLINISNVIKSSCRNEDLIFRIGGDEIAIILPLSTYEDAQVIKERIIKNCKEAPVNPIPLSISLGIGTKDNKNQDIKDILKNGEKELYKEKIRSQEKLCYGEFAISFIVEAIRDNLVERVSDIEEHVKNTMEYSTIIGNGLLYSEYELNELNLAAMLHDIGIAAIEDEHLCKSMLDLDRNDIKLLSDHTEKGYRIVKSYSNLGNIDKTILNHHENWDGTGYPFGVSGEAIPLNARIIHLASDFDIIVRRNMRKDPLRYKEKSINEIVKEKGKRFDPKLVDILVSNYK